MIKKLITLLFIWVLSITAFAGALNPYIEVENVGWSLVPECTIGVYTEDYIGSSAWSLSADAFVFNEDLVTLNSPVEVSLDLGLGREWFIDVADPGNDIYHGIDFSVKETIIVNQGTTLQQFGLNSFETTVGIDYFFGNMKVWAEGLFAYGVGTWFWVCTPTVGFSIGR